MIENICEESVFERVYHQQVDSLRNFLYYKCGNLQMAEDLTHDAFSKLWESCAKVAFQKAKSFVFTIGNNMFLNKVKRDKVILKFENAQPANSEVHDPHFLMEEQEFQQKLETAISNLPETQREVFLMNRIDKMKYREIADLLNISVKAVEKRMHLALKSLKAIHDKI